MQQQQHHHWHCFDGQVYKIFSVGSIGLCFFRHIFVLLFYRARTARLLFNVHAHTSAFFFIEIYRSVGLSVCFPNGKYMEYKNAQTNQIGYIVCHHTRACIQTRTLTCIIVSYIVDINIIRMVKFHIPKASVRLQHTISCYCCYCCCYCHHGFFIPINLFRMEIFGIERRQIRATATAAIAHSNGVVYM